MFSGFSIPHFGPNIISVVLLNVSGLLEIDPLDWDQVDNCPTWNSLRNVTLVDVNLWPLEDPYDYRDTLYAPISRVPCVWLAHLSLCSCWVGDIDNFYLARSNLEDVYAIPRFECANVI